MNYASTNILSDKKQKSVQFTVEVANEKTNLVHNDITEDPQVLLDNYAGSLEKTEQNIYLKTCDEKIFDNNHKKGVNTKIPGNDYVLCQNNNQMLKYDNIEDKELSDVQKFIKSEIVF